MAKILLNVEVELIQQEIRKLAEVLKKINKFELKLNKEGAKTRGQLGVFLQDVIALVGYYGNDVADDLDVSKSVIENLSIAVSNISAILQREKTYALKTETAQALTDAKAYTDAKIAKIPVVDLSPYRTAVNQDVIDAKTLADAKAYTDAEIGKIPSSNWEDVSDDFFTKPPETYENDIFRLKLNDEITRHSDNTTKDHLTETCILLYSDTDTTNNSLSLRFTLGGGTILIIESANKTITLDNSTGDIIASGVFKNSILERLL